MKLNDYYSKYVWTAVLAAVFAGGTLASLPLAAADQAWIAPRTEYGAPDLQGNWNKQFRTPLQRPEELGEKRAYSEEEARQYIEGLLAQELSRTRPLAADRDAPPVGDFIGTQSDLNFFPELPSNPARVNGEYRTSLIVKPDNGRLPYRETVQDYRDRLLNTGFGAFDGPEVRPASERCLNQGAQIPYMISVAGRTIQIVQTRDYIVILNEVGPQVRIIRMRGGHSPADYPKWMGDSVGHWEGDSLVVHTTGFRPEQSNIRIRSSDKLEVTETYTLKSDQELLYSYTMVDPEVYTEPVVVEIPFQRMAEGEVLYEAACHEGNYSLPGILAGARRQELDAALATNQREPL